MQKNILMLGLSFKPETDDVRESVSLKLLDLLMGKVKSLSAHDPIANANAKRALREDADIEFVKDWEAALAKADVIIISTNWPVYTSLKTFLANLAGKIVFDTRSLLKKSDFPNSLYLTIN